MWDFLTGAMVIIGCLVIGALLCLFVAGMLRIISYFHDRGLL